MASELSDPDKLVSVVTLQPDGFGNPLVYRVDTDRLWAEFCDSFREQVLASEDHQKWVIEQDRMTVGDLAALPEHEGW